MARASLPLNACGEQTPDAGATVPCVHGASAGAHLTLSVPSIPGWNVQRYLKVPARSKVWR